MKDDILFRKWRPSNESPEEEWRAVQQIVVPTVYRKDILHICLTIHRSRDIWVSRKLTVESSNIFLLAKDVT